MAKVRTGIEYREETFVDTWGRRLRNHKRIHAIDWSRAEKNSGWLDIPGWQLDLETLYKQDRFSFRRHWYRLEPRARKPYNSAKWDDVCEISGLVIRGIVTLKENAWRSCKITLAEQILLEVMLRKLGAI